MTSVGLRLREHGNVLQLLQIEGVAGEEVVDQVREIVLAAELLHQLHTFVQIASRHRWEEMVLDLEYEESFSKEMLTHSAIKIEKRVAFTLLLHIQRRLSSFNPCICVCLLQLLSKTTNSY